MANHKSAKKRIRQTLRRRKTNKIALGILRSLEKSLRQTIEKKDKQKAVQLLKAFYCEMDRSARKINRHKKTISRKKAQMALLVNNI